MGLLQQSARQWVAWRPASIEIDEGRVEASIAARNAARKARNFKEADRIRDELAKMGVVLHDSKDGTTWEVAR
jgi:cysteinyl-tRNA synthetase